MKSIFASISCFFFASFSHAWEVSVPIEEMLKRTDVVVVGALTGVRSETVGETDNAQGTIEVTESLLGNLAAPQKIILTWSNPSKLGCPRITHKDTGGIQYVWLLQRQKDGTFKSDSNSRMVALKDKQQVIRCIQR